MLNEKGFVVQGQRRLFIDSKLKCRSALFTLIQEFMNLEGKIYCEC